MPEIALEFPDIIAELCLGQFRDPLLGMEWIGIERGVLGRISQNVMEARNLTRMFCET